MKFLAKDRLVEVQEEFDTFQELIKQSANDPVMVPYQSKYKAFEMLEKMKESLNTVSKTESGVEEHLAALGMYLLVNCGIIKAEVEEFTLAEKFLIKSLETGDNVQEEKYTLSGRLSAHNQLGIIWCMRDDLIKSRQHLEKALNIYFNFQNENSKEIFLFEHLVYPYSDPFEKAEEAKKSIEMVVTHTYYYLAQVHGKLGNSKKAAEFCHETLSRQLQVGEYDPLDWATNAAVLSQFYINQDNFKSSRYHLASASIIFDKHFSDGVAEMDEDKREAVAKCRGQIDKLSGKYGLYLLEFSHSESILAKVESMVQDVMNAEDEAVENPEFEGLDVSDRLEEVTDRKISDWETARQTFLWTQKKLTRSQEYFRLEEHCSENVEIVREMSQLYKHLIYFEADSDRKSKMHRRRADLLEPLLTELSLEHYLLVIRQIRFELGEIFSDMMDLKVERLNSEPGNPGHVKKVNLMVQQAAHHFQAFLDTMLDKEGRAPEMYNEDTVRPAMLAHFHLGRLASKRVVEENTEQHLRNVLTTLAKYKMIVDYCSKHPEAKAAMDEEFEVCSEMVRLLPIKVDKIKRNLVRSNSQ